MSEGRGPAPARVLLIGMMASGKSTVGRTLASITGWPYIDNDELVVAVMGVDAKILLAQQGEPALRVAEAKALEEAVRRPEPLIAGIAAGVVTDAANRATLKGGGFVVYLRATIETLAARIARSGQHEHRPWVDGDATAALRALYDGREPLYREVADLVIDVDDATPQDTAERIVAALAEAR